MKKLLISAVAAVFSLTACFKDGNIEVVKAGVMDFDKSLKVGQAFGNWSQCTTKNWSEIKTSNGRKVVQFECKSTLVRDFSQFAKSEFSPYFDGISAIAEEMIITFQWTINTDDTFQLTGLSKNFKWSDGAETSDRSVNESLLKSVYANEFEYDVALLKTPSGFDIAKRRMGDLNIFRNGWIVSPPTKAAARPAESPTAGNKKNKEEDSGD